MYTLDSLFITLFILGFVTSMFVTGIEVAFLISFPAIFPETDNISDRKQKLMESVLENPMQSFAALWFTKIVWLTVSIFCFAYLGWHWLQMSGLVTMGVLIPSILLTAFVALFGMGILARRNPLIFLKSYFKLVGVFQLLSGAFTIKLFHSHHFLTDFILNAKSPLHNIQFSQKQEKVKDGSVSDQEMLKGIVKFGQIEVSEILCPRVDVVAIELSSPLSKVLEIVVESGYSRIPVFAGNFDNVKGILFVKDLLPYLSSKDSFRWQTLIRPSYFVPETKKVKDLLTEFKTSKIHIAIVVDEYGGTLGIVTLEDILEEIVGEISDESDEDEKYYTRLNDNTFIFDGKIQVNDLQKVLQTENDFFDEARGDADTLAGLILELKGAIPAKNELIVYKQFNFRIIGVDARRIKKVKVSVVEE